MYYRINDCGEMVAVRTNEPDVLAGRVEFGRQRRLRFVTTMALTAGELRDLAQALDDYNGPAAAGEDDNDR